MNIRKYIGLLLAFNAVALFMHSCSDDISIENAEPEKQTFFSVLLNAPGQKELRSSGDPDVSAESKVYSLEVLVFKSADQAEAGALDGYGSVARTTRDVTGQAYDKEYVEINEIKNVGLTAGKRDVYVVANAPDGYFSAVTNLQGFLQKYEELSRQGHYPHPGTVTPDPDEDLPIGGLNPSDLKTNLTMCNYMEGVQFNNLHDHHYLGYTDNSGRPVGVDPGQGWLLNGTNPFLVERLAARVAIGKIEFELPASLPFEGVAYPSSDYTYQIDSVFMLNVKTTSVFAAGSTAGFTEKYGHGCNRGYAFLNNAARLNNLNPQSQYADFLVEAITTPHYDISVNATPLWFYAFENGNENYPTYFVIGVKYNFLSSTDHVAKTVKSYYPVVVNAPRVGKAADHDYIKRNHQYLISVKIKGLGSMYGNNPVPLRSLQEVNTIEVTETVGQQLFPWTGDIYK